MPMPNSNLTFKFLALLIIFIQIWITGCQPKAPVSYDSIHFTDKDITEFNSRLKTMMQRNMNWSSITRYTSSVMAIGAAASAGALGIAGVSSDIIGFTALGGGFIGELQGIFNARDKAHAYQQGVEMIHDAHIRYIDNLAHDASNKGSASNQHLTKAGAKLYSESLAALKVVEKTLVAEIPTIEELEKAMGKYQRFSVHPAEVHFSDPVEGKGNPSLEITALAGGPIKRVSSQDSSIISAKIKSEDDNKVVLELLNRKGLQDSSKGISITFKNNDGDTATIKASESNNNGAETPPKLSLDIGAKNEFEKSMSKDDVMEIQAKLKSSRTRTLDKEVREKIKAFKKSKGLKPADDTLTQEIFNKIRQEATNNKS